MPVHKVSYFTVATPNTPGQGLRVLAALRKAGVNLHAYSGFPSGAGAQLDFIPENAAKFKAVARKLKLKVSPRKIAFMLQGPDTVGALTSTVSKLAKARVNITAMHAVVAGRRRYGAIFWVRKQSVGKAARLLRAK